MVASIGVRPDAHRPGRMGTAVRVLRHADGLGPRTWSLFLSRNSAGHIGGMTTVLKNFKPKELWLGVVPPSPALESVIATAQALGIKVVRRWEGDEFGFGAVTVGVRFPPRD
jgi:hypothetical protein